jgi:hypothetical protein
VRRARRSRQTRARGGRVVAVGTTAVRSLETAAAGGRPAPIRRHPSVHLPGLPLPLCRRHDHQFPPAGIDAADAGECLLGPRAGPGGLRGGRARALPLLQLWRRDVPPDPGAGRGCARMEECTDGVFRYCCPFIPSRRRGAARPLHFARGSVETPAFMPVGTYGTVKGMTAGGCRGMAPRSSSATPSISGCVRAPRSSARTATCTTSCTGSVRSSPIPADFQVFSLGELRKITRRRRIPSPVDGARSSWGRRSRWRCSAPSAPTSS